MSADQKELFERAAKFQGRTLTDFVIISLQEAALRTLGEVSTIQLTPKESYAFADALLPPHEPGSHLRKAAKRAAQLTMAPPPSAR